MMLHLQYLEPGEEPLGKNDIRIWAGNPFTLGANSEEYAFFATLLKINNLLIFITILNTWNLTKMPGDQILNL